MNVPYLLTTVPKTKDAATLLDRFFAVVIVDILGMGRFAQVKNYNLQSKYPYYHSFGFIKKLTVSNSYGILEFYFLPIFEFSISRPKYISHFSILRFVIFRSLLFRFLISCFLIFRFQVFRFLIFKFLIFRFLIISLLIFRFLISRFFIFGFWFLCFRLVCFRFVCFRFSWFRFLGFRFLDFILFKYSKPEIIHINYNYYIIISITLGGTPGNAVPPPFLQGERRPSCQNQTWGNAVPPESDRD